jgi:archaemetzincin
MKDDRLLEVVSSGVREILEISTEIVPVDISLKDGWNTERNQHNSNWILSQLLQKLPTDSDKIIGITDYDLYMPILSYVFGEAELGGRAAIVSTYRLQNELYGLPASQASLESRALKEAVHELGHTFGLVHCRNQKCVMRSSTYVEEIDLKTENFCSDCIRVLNQQLQNK